MNKRQQNKIEKLLFKIYDSGLKQVDCDLTTCAKEIEKALIIDGVSKLLTYDELKLIIKESCDIEDVRKKIDHRLN